MNIILLYQTLSDVLYFERMGIPLGILIVVLIALFYRTNKLENTDDIDEQMFHAIIVIILFVILLILIVWLNYLSKLK